MAKNKNKVKPGPSSAVATSPPAGAFHDPASDSDDGSVAGNLSWPEILQLMSDVANYLTFGELMKCAHAGYDPAIMRKELFTNFRREVLKLCMFMSMKSTNISKASTIADEKMADELPEALEAIQDGCDHIKGFSTDQSSSGKAKAMRQISVAAAPLIVRLNSIALENGAPAQPMKFACGKYSVLGAGSVVPDNVLPLWKSWALAWGNYLSHQVGKIGQTRDEFEAGFQTYQAASRTPENLKDAAAMMNASTTKDFIDEGEIRRMAKMYIDDLGYG